MQEFMIETGLHGTFGEIYEVEKKERDITFECRRKCIDVCLTSNGMLECACVTELVEYN